MLVKIVWNNFQMKAQAHMQPLRMALRAGRSILQYKLGQIPPPADATFCHSACDMHDTESCLIPATIACKTLGSKWISCTFNLLVSHLNCRNRWTASSQLSSVCLGMTSWTSSSASWIYIPIITACIATRWTQTSVKALCASRSVHWPWLCCCWTSSHVWHQE